MAPRIILVGPSASGKTTVGRMVANALGVPLVSMDDFRRPGKFTTRGPNGEKVRTFEHPGLWDADRIAIRLFDAIEANRGFVAEGNHLLHYPLIRAIPDTQCYYLEVPFATVLERRSQRARHSVSDQSFTLVGREETARYVEPQLRIPFVHRMDGTLTPPELAASLIGAARELTMESVSR